MAIPAARIDDRQQATKFRAWVGLVVDVQPHYCDIGDPDFIQVDLSPVIIFDLSVRRVCEDVDVAWDLSNSYSPTHNLASYEVGWGDGNITAGAWGGGPSGNYGAAAGEWDLAGAASAVFTITIIVWDDTGLASTIQEQIEVIDCSVFPFMAYAGLKAGGGVYAATTWTDISGGLTGGFLTVNDIDINGARMVGGYPQVWIATNGGIAWTNNDGVTWRILSIPDPPNSWNDAPAPSAGNLIYYKFARKDSDTLYCIVYYQNGTSQYRGYLLLIEDNGTTLTWYNLGSDNLSATTWGMPEAVFTTPWCDENPASGNAVRTLINPLNILYDNGAGGGVRVDFYGRDDNEYLWQRLLLVDFGTWFQLNAAVVDAGINEDVRLLSSTDSMTITVPADVDLYIQATQLDWYACWSGALQNLGIWDGAVDGYPPAAPSVKTAARTQGSWGRYAWVILSANAAARYRGTGFHRHLFDYIKIYPSAVNDQVWPLDLAVDKETGRWLYMTTWEGNALRLRVYDTELNHSHPVTIMVTEISVTSFDVALRTNWIGVKSLGDPRQPNYGSRCAVHGRITNTQHVWIVDMISDYYYDVDGTFTDPPLAANYASGLIWFENDLMYLVVNIGGNSTLYETDDYGATWTNLGNVGFEVEEGAAVDNPDYYEILVGNMAAGAAVAYYLMDLAGSFFDVSTGLPVAEGINVLRILSERY